MPINAPVEYYKAEEKFKSAKNREEKIRALEEMIRYLPKHKGTENLLRDLRRRLAKLRAERETKPAPKPRFVIKKEGAGQVCLIGLTNSGKSTLLKKLTGVEVEIADHPYTTQEPKIGMMEYKDVQIQIVEIPSTFTKELMSIVRGCDGIVFVIDGEKDLFKQKEELLKIMEENRIKINEEPKDIKVERRPVGGIEIRGVKYLKGDVEEVKQILIASGYNNCVLVLNQPCTIDDIMDALDKSLVYKNAIFVVTKNEYLDVEELKEEIWKMLGLIRVYTKAPNKDKPEEKPVTLPVGSTVKDLVERLHKDFLKHFKFAKVVGKSVKHGKGRVGLDHVLEDGDIVEIHT
ncbi:MAG: TGS domain-containing protein [Candidatus Aenigmarchaeota archaeon]|nr:TGS domain-containing protein [Candidatus Aenigmarchaeota archaeon]